MDDRPFQDRRQVMSCPDLINAPSPAPGARVIDFTTGQESKSNYRGCSHQTCTTVGSQLDFCHKLIPLAGPARGACIVRSMHGWRLAGLISLQVQSLLPELGWPTAATGCPPRNSSLCVAISIGVREHKRHTAPALNTIPAGATPVSEYYGQTFFL